MLQSANRNFIKLHLKPRGSFSALAWALIPQSRRFVSGDCIRCLVFGQSRSRAAFSTFAEEQSRQTASHLQKAELQDHGQIELHWHDGSAARFHMNFLRTCCMCPVCQHVSGQRIICSADFGLELAALNIFVKDDALIITWELDGHKSTFTGTWLRENIYDIKSGEINTSRTSPAAISYWKDIPTLCWESYMGSDSGVYELLHNVVQHGVCIIKNTPLRVDEVKNVAERIAPISHGFLYGDVFDVVVEKRPINIAYTSQALKLHLDLSYYESPPGLQFLHALRFDSSIKGGESTLVDVFDAAAKLQREMPHHFDALTRIPATFKKYHLDRENIAIMEYQRPHIQLNHLNEIVAVFWSPPFEGPLRVPFDDVRPYYAAYKAFHDIIECEDRILQCRLNEGDTIVFNQRRMLHGRTEFELQEDESRHFQGTYVNIDDAVCRYNALQYRLLGHKNSNFRHRVGNGSFR